MVRELRKEPLSWADQVRAKPTWSLPFHALEWLFQWTAFYLSRWALLEVLEYLGSLSVLVAVVFYYSEAGDRKKLKHYQAWQVINTAQGKGGSGGRIEALHELNEDKVPLVGVDVSGAFLQGVDLVKAAMLRANLSAADLRDSVLRNSDLEFANLNGANFRRADLSGADLRDSVLQDSDLTSVNLTGANLARADLADADLTKADLKGVRWQGILSVKAANLYQVRNAPDGFLAWAMANGAVSAPGSDE